MKRVLDGVLAAFGLAFVRIDGSVYRVHNILGIPVVYVNDATLPLRPDGSAGYFSHCRWEPVIGRVGF